MGKKKEINSVVCWFISKNKKFYSIQPLAKRNKEWLVEFGDYQVIDSVKKEEAWQMAEQMYAQIMGWA